MVAIHGWGRTVIGHNSDRLGDYVMVLGVFGIEIRFFYTHCIVLLFLAILLSYRILVFLVILSGAS